jgi:murein L,D-transpeptidase YcbB/YkuD
LNAIMKPVASPPRLRLPRPAAWLAAAALALVVTPAAARPAPAAAPPVTLATQLRASAERDLQGFYAARAYRPLWLDAEGRPLPAASELVALIRTSDLDGLDPETFDASGLATMLAAPGDPLALELRLSRAFARYVNAMREPRATAMVYEHALLRPAPRPAGEVLQQAATAPALAEYVRSMGWMQPLYGALRASLAADPAPEPAVKAAALANMRRLAAIPPGPAPRYVLVDAAGARLYMYENGRVVDSMRVVVGKPDNQTPMIAGYIRYAIFNPYWNVPLDLVRRNIAPNVISRGASYLRGGGYEVLSDWSSAPSVVDPSKVDWRAVASGKQELRVRQLPGGDNFMGKVKYEFPNDLGIYLHDTPDKDLLLKDARQFSSGCIRLEDADRLGRWLLRGAEPEVGTAAEQRVDLPQAVPVYVTYLTTAIEGGRIALRADPYHRDPAPSRAFAQNGGDQLTARR